MMSYMLMAMLLMDKEIKSGEEGLGLWLLAFGPGSWPLDKPEKQHATYKPVG